MPAFRGHFSVQGSAVGGLSYKVKNSVAAFLVTKPRIHQQIPTICSAGGQAVTALVSGMAVMALDPVERHFMRVHRDEQPFPEVRIFYRSRLRADPVMLYPAIDPFLVEGVHEIF